ncbi:MAG: carboxypeptidase-like regulatory domain-containing protein [Chlorobi bacterium]|nr:carboxypeptidase-like regulatory domain-containing protein [Chlorobiota bacterium]
MNTYKILSRYFVVVCLSILFLWGCEKPTSPGEKVLDEENYIHLQNQTNHSGVLVKILETSAMAITDSLGYFTLPKVIDGEYTLQAKYPFFKIVEQSVVISDSVLQTKIELELEQQLQFWVEPAETTLTMADKTRFWEFRGYATNISDSIVSGISYTLPKNWGIIPENLDWNFADNSIDSKFCYENLPNIGLTDLTAIGGFSIMPGDTGITKYKDVWLLGFECTPPGRTYLLFFSLVDQKYFDEYFQRRFFIDGKVDNNQIMNPLTISLFKKRELFRPAIIHFKN